MEISPAWPTLTALLAAAAGVKLAVALRGASLVRWLWSATAWCAALVFARPALALVGLADLSPARALLPTLAALSILSLLEVYRQTQRSVAPLLAAGALASALAAWPVSLVSVPVAAALCYPPLWGLFGAILLWPGDHHGLRARHPGHHPPRRSGRPRARAG